MEGEYILKSGHETRLIPKSQWDQTKDDYTFRLIPLCKGTFRDYIIGISGREIPKNFPAIIGIAKSMNDINDKGTIVCVYEYEHGKYLHEWIKSIKGALKYDVNDILTSKDIFKALVKALIELDPSVSYEEFIKIVKSIVLGYVLYKYIESAGITPFPDFKKYHYTLYKEVLNGKLDYETYVKITKIKDDIIEISPKYIHDLKERYEMAQMAVEYNN